MIWHLTYSSDGRWPLFADEDSVRRGVRALGRVAGRELVLFGLADDHAHCVVRCWDLAHRGRIATGLALALRPLVSAPLLSPDPRPVRTRSHLIWLVRYLLTQLQHHGLPMSPLLWSGSCFLDLVGARVVAGLKLAIGELLPRQRVSDYYAAIGAAPARALTDESIRVLGPHRIVRAAAASLAAPIALGGRERVVVEARRAAAHLSHLVGVASSETRWALRVTRQGLAKLVSADLPRSILSAVRIRLALEEAASQAKSADPPALVVAGATGRTG